MKKLTLLLISLLAASVAGLASPRGLGAYLSHATFNVPGQGPYLETYLEILGNTIRYKAIDGGKFQGSVQVTMIIKQDSVIRDFRKYELLSPEVSDTTAVGINFIDQQRFMLPDGNYTIDLSIADINSPRKPHFVTYPVSISFPADQLSVSGIQMISAYSKTITENVLSKSGYDFVPFVDNFYPSDKNKLTFYAEIYNPLHQEGSEEKYLVSAFIESFETKKILTDYVRVKKEPSRPVNVLVNEFDITQLPSGNYNLVVNVRNKSNEVIAQNITFFQRSNPGVGSPAIDLASVSVANTFADRISNADTLREYLRSMQPIATEMESIFIRSQLNTASLEMLKQFFLNFWRTRDETNPEATWEAYKFEVKKVNVAYKTQLRKGYETDMGRVYLRYGPPNSIVDRPFETTGYNLNAPVNGKPERGSVPYQIWHYYSINNNRERNRKFVFISSSLKTMDYMLVHSDAMGEIQNFNWQRMLSRDLDIEDYNADTMKKDRRTSSFDYNDGF
ncbi:MAG: GWxTD domain-containing protein [Bacteroidales bacterium]|nr:GWxTD domain-containing protein [Bacteroidales bacterium]